MGNCACVAAPQLDKRAGTAPPLADSPQAGSRLVQSSSTFSLTTLSPLGAATRRLALAKLGCAHLLAPVALAKLGHAHLLAPVQDSDVLAAIAALVVPQPAEVRVTAAARFRPPQICLRGSPQFARDIARQFQYLGADNSARNHGKFDRAGVLYHLSTQGGTVPWSNPHKAGHVAWYDPPPRAPAYSSGPLTTTAPRAVFSQHLVIGVQRPGEPPGLRPVRAAELVLHRQ